MSPARGHALGRLAEEAASDHLVARGFCILGQNVRLGALELDIVACKDDLLLVVEVKARKPGALLGPLASVGKTKRARLLRATAALLRTPPFPLGETTRVRIDVCAVHRDGGSTAVEWFEGAVTGK